MKSETLTPNMEQNKASVEATIESNALGGTESSCNNNNGETSGITSDAEHEKSLEYAEELMVRGSKADKEHDYAEATDCYSRALEIRASHYGELALECVNAYYKYGCALLYKAQDEADILGSVPKKEDKSQEDSAKDESVKSVKSAESSTASVDTEENGSSNHQEETPNDDDGGNDGGDADDESDTEDLAEADEDESDLDLAWKMLDVARAIVEKHPDDTMEKVDILSALAEVALEREDIESSTSDYLKALSILERLVEPDSRHIASLNFRICLCLEIGSKAQEAIPYCQKAMSVCKSRVQRLMDEAKSSTASVSVESDQNVQLSSSTLVDSAAVKDEIETLTGLLGDLERKLEDLQQLVSNPPTPILADILGMVTAKAKGHEKGAYSTFMSSSQMGLASTGNQDSPTISTAHTNGTGVTHLGVVGRGVKRVLMNSGSTESNPMKKPAIDPPADKGDGKAS